MNRAEHLEWCRRRALKYIELGDISQAFASMTSDLRKHPDTEEHFGIELGMRQLMAGFLDTPEEMRRFINGFN